jgi:hypothetical protein
MMMRAISRVFDSTHKTWRRIGRDQSGSVMTLMVAVPVVMGAAAVGLETGQIYRTKRQMQGAADAAALAGSFDLLNNQSSAVTSDAQFQAQRNGFQNGVNGVTVTVNTPPTSGSNVGTNGAVEVIVNKSQSFSLGAVLARSLGATSSNYTITARSVAAQGTMTSTTNQTVTTTTTTLSGDGCMIALTPNNEQGVSITSFGNFTSDCKVYSNGTATGTGATTASIYMANFGSATIKGGLWTRGSFVATSYGSISPAMPNTAQQNQTTTLGDPYANLAAPSPGACTYNPFTAGSGTSITLSPGVYCGGLAIKGGYSNVYVTPGTYYIVNGDLYLSGVSTVSCPTCTADQGTTFVLTQNTGNGANVGGVYISSDSTVTLNAPSTKTSQPYPGVLFYQDRTATAGTMTSTSKIFTVSSLSSATLTGAIYFPNNAIVLSSFSNASSSNGCTVWIGRYLKFSSYANNYTAGCKTIGTQLGGVATTTTTTSTQPVTTATTTSRVLE